MKLLRPPAASATAAAAPSLAVADPFYGRWRGLGDLSRLRGGGVADFHTCGRGPVTLTFASLTLTNEGKLMRTG